MSEQEYPVDQPETTAPVTEEATASNEPVDVDEQELRDAIAAAKAEEEAVKTEQEEEPSSGTEAQEPSEPPKDNREDKQQQSMPMIPKARLDEVLSERDKHLQEAAYWRGVAESRNAGSDQQQQRQPPQITPEQHLEAIHLQHQDLAKKFDDGEIGMAEYVNESRKLQDRAYEVRESALLSKMQQDRPAGPDDDFGLAAETAKLEQAHPWVQVLEQLPENDADWDYLRGMASSNLKSKGINPAEGKFGTYQLRREIAELADKYGPALFGPRAQAAGIALPTTPNHPQTEQPQKLSPTAQARRGKLEQMGDAPPNIAAMTGSASDSGSPSAASIESMTDDEIGSLPDSVRRKFLGIT